VSALALDTPARVAARLLPRRALTSHSAYLDAYGPLPPLDPSRLLEQIDRSGLAGRGGAGFPTGRKLRIVAAGRSPIVVANGTEGEPASAKDKVLLTRNPHLVIDGALAAATAVGAGDVIVAVSRADAAGYARLEAALRGRRDARNVQLRSAPEGFLSGEESALVRWLNGGPAKPTVTPPRPFESGVNGRPTLVQNVETLANVALIARRGADWFRELGSDDEPGSVLVTLLGAVRTPGVSETELGAPVANVVDRHGGLAEPVGALLVGGYFGSWLPVSTLRQPLSRAGLGVSLGARTLVALPARTCGLVETARIVRYLAGESAGQCGPCLFGLGALASAIESVAARDARAAHSHARLTRLGGQIAGRGACAHPDGAVRLLASALDVFAEEVDAHLGGVCTATDVGSVLPWS
jgi:NADH:ubiquinone oxidoreductase subunit F (NADH-binding)